VLVEQHLVYGREGSAGKCVLHRVVALSASQERPDVAPTPAFLRAAAGDGGGAVAEMGWAVASTTTTRPGSIAGSMHQWSAQRKHVV
jgi:hypothetical protein